MKRFVILLFCSIIGINLVSAQNANRNGAFIELGLGGLVGNTIRNSIQVTNNVLQYRCVSGVAVDLGAGYRVRIARNWAYEAKVEVQDALSCIEASFIARGLPVGFRYTSKELWRNFSVYGHFNIGVAMSLMNGFFGGLPTIYPDTPLISLKDHPVEEAFGFAYSVGVGVNLTSHLYLEGCWNSQALFNCFGRNGKGTVNGGFAGVIIGYRF